MAMMPDRYFEVIHTPAFVATAKGILTEAMIRDLEIMVAASPAAGVVIPETDGVRKVRIALPGRGKSGGARVIYYAYTRREQIYLFFVYAKNDRADMTEAQKRDVRRAVKIIQAGG